MKISYYPGCTLKNTAKNFEISAIAAARQLGVEFVELPKWNCCGTVYSLTSDDLMHQLAPIRNLLRVEENGFDRVVTLCSMCYNTLKRANLMVNRSPENLKKINDFMYKERTRYSGKVRVLHFLEILRDEIGLDEIRKHVKKPLKGLKFATYYGCLLVRPPEAAMDDVENPHFMGELIEALGGEVVDFPYSTECCGSYNTVSRKQMVLDKTYEIINMAHLQGADALILSCPLCDFNLEARQKDVAEVYPDFHYMPVLYFTQLMTVAFGLDPETYGFEFNTVDPMPLFKEKGVL